MFGYARSSNKSIIFTWGGDFKLCHRQLWGFYGGGHNCVFLWVLCFLSCFSISRTQSLRLSFCQFPSGQRDSSNPALRGTNEQNAPATWALVPANQQHRDDCEIHAWLASVGVFLCFSFSESRLAVSKQQWGRQRRAVRSSCTHQQSKGSTTLRRWIYSECICPASVYYYLHLLLPDAILFVFRGGSKCLLRNLFR